MKRPMSRSPSRRTALRLLAQLPKSTKGGSVSTLDTRRVNALLRIARQARGAATGDVVLPPL